ncbi:MAG TPA: CocE/NonD family hydrolase [Candidatus Dormibacteraeota bacterium]|nr:CocE/NonD family hydrolase [Candidatus Dormibacteraeota bacterium]
MALALAGVAVGASSAAAQNSGVPVPAPGCAASASCTYQLLSGVLAVTNGPPSAPGSANIEYDIYKPNAATALAPQPAVMYFNGFGGGKADSSAVALGKFLSSHGYVVLTFSSEGFSGSTGKIELDSPEYDVKNAEQLITLLAAKDYVLKDAAGDPRIGLTGGSYGGAIQIMTAEFDPRVDAITPFRTWNTLEYSLAPNNLQSNFHAQSLPCCGVPKFEWTSLFFASGATTPLNGHGDGIQGTFLDPVPTNHECIGFDHRLCLIYTQSALQGSAAPSKALLDNSSPETYFAPGVASFDPTQISYGLNVPTLIGQGELDTLFNLNDAVANYDAIKARGVPVSMIWHSNGHGYDDVAGEGDVFGNDQSSPGTKYLPQRILAWFDRYVRLDTSVDTGPGFAYFRDWVPFNTASAAPAYGTAPAFPAQAPVTFTLSGSSDLVGPGSQAVAGSAVVVSPPKGVPGAYTETSNFQCSTCSLPGPPNNVNFSGVAPTNIPGQFADFTSKPFLRDVVSVGIPTAHLHLSSVTNSDVILFGKVWDVDGAGNATLIKRLIAPVRVFNTNQAVDMNLLGFAHMFPKGHSVRFEVATTDLTSTSDHVLADVVTLTQSASSSTASTGFGRVVDALFPSASAAGDPSTFSLPVDGTSTTVVPPTNPVAGSPETLPNTAVAPVMPALLVVLLGVGFLVALRARRRRGTS